ncbi:MAG: Arginyl-tRNA--protein transferase 1 [Thelocarpon superellum]|nr:MAG: Arginyl-tRNA--protein transferase 1 [Thelocarpon superellum]
MGVLDLLPQCVSSVYFLYHDDFKKWNFGKLGALREASMAKENGYRWYYMGYFIPSCSKMRYKADYSPQHLLDPETYTWHPLDDDLKRRLDEKSFVSVSKECQNPPGEDKLAQTASPTTASKASEVSHGGAAHAGEDEEQETEDMSDDDDDDAQIHLSTSVFEMNMPGVMTKEEIEDHIDLDATKVRVAGRILEVQDLVAWDDGEVENPRSLKGLVGEFVAVVGPELAKEVVLFFSG